MVRSTISCIIIRFQEKENVHSKPRSPRVTTDKQWKNRYIVRTVRINASITVLALKPHYQVTYCRVISTTIVRRHVLRSGLWKRSPMRVSGLTPSHTQTRFLWAQEYSNWLLPQWTTVVLSDEFIFGVVSDNYYGTTWPDTGRQRLNAALEDAPYWRSTEMF